jgi:hypothetical protein
MSVTQEAVVKNYLAKRPDRGQFYYFRYVEKGQPDYYILTYGAFATVSQALDALKKIDFELPDSIKVEPKRFHDYQSHIVDSNGDQEIEGASVRGKVYAVSLHQVAIPVEAPPTIISNTSSNLATSRNLTTSTTIRTTANESGNTSSAPEVSVTRSESTSTPSAPKPDSSIKDPFN